MPGWLRDCISVIVRVLVTIAALSIAGAFGFAVHRQIGGSFWVVVLSAIAFAVFVVLPLHLALVLHRSRRRIKRNGPATG